MGMVRKFPGIISRKSENRWISEMRTIQPKVLKIPEQSWMERNFLQDIFENLSIPRKVVLFLEIF